MPWGQEQQQAREAATALFKLVGAIEKDLARLQEQQRSDEGRYKELRKDLIELRHALQALELRYKDYDELLGRIQHLEAMLTTFGADFGRMYVSQREFEDYKLELREKADQLRVDLAEAEAAKIKKSRQQFGLIGASFALGVAPALPKIFEAMVDLIHRLLKN